MTNLPSVVQNISAVLTRIDKMFDRLHPNHKIGSMFMEQYEFEPDSEEEKLRRILNNVLTQLHDIAESISKHNYIKLKISLGFKRHNNQLHPIRFFL